MTPRISRLRDSRLVINCDKDDNMHKHESQPSGIYVWRSSDVGASIKKGYAGGAPIRFQ